MAEGRGVWTHWGDIKKMRRPLINYSIYDFKERRRMNGGDFFIFTFMFFYSFISRPSDSSVSGDAGFEPRTLAWESDALTHRVNRVPPPPLWFRGSQFGRGDRHCVTSMYSNIWSLCSNHSAIESSTIGNFAAHFEIRQDYPAWR